MIMRIFGHRCTIAPEADGMELDVVITTDNVLVVNHDPVVGAAAELPYPRLEAVLDLPLEKDYWFDIESKNAPPELMAAVIRAYRERRRMMVRSFDHEFLRAFHAIEPEIPLAALINYDADNWAAIARGACANTISPLHTTVNADRVKRAHDAGIEVSAWTANTPEDWIRLAATGIDTLITDDPVGAKRATSVA
jgi:glycerophosphoryl diester phosphodiesterase